MRYFSDNSSVGSLEDLLVMPDGLPDDAHTSEEISLDSVQGANLEDNILTLSGREKHKKHFLIKLLLLAISSYLIAFFLRANVVQYTMVSGASMENTLHDRDILLVDKISYAYEEPERFDIIIFNPDDSNREQLYVKRVIGLPGETIQIINNTILINDKPLDEHYGNSIIIYQGIASAPVTLGDDEYFVLGDNRCISKDSRYLDVGPVSKSKIRGKVIFRLQPYSQLGFIK